jgi:hypothetical protein
MIIEEINNELYISYSSTPLDPSDANIPFITNEINSIIVDINEWNFGLLAIQYYPDFLYYPINPGPNMSDPIILEYHIVLKKEDTKKLESIILKFRSKIIAREYLKIMGKELNKNITNIYSELGDQFKI